MPITEPGIMMIANSLRRAPPDLAAATTIMINATNTDNAIQAALLEPADCSIACSTLWRSELDRKYQINNPAKVGIARRASVTVMHHSNASRQGLPASWQDAFKL